MSLRPSLNGCWGGGGIIPDWQWASLNILTYSWILLRLWDMVSSGLGLCCGRLPAHYWCLWHVFWWPLQPNWTGWLVMPARARSNGSQPSSVYRVLKWRTSASSQRMSVFGAISIDRNPPSVDRRWTSLKKPNVSKNDSTNLRYLTLDLLLLLLSRLPHRSLVYNTVPNHVTACTFA